MKPKSRTVRGHAAVQLVRELVELLDENPIVRQYVKATPKTMELEVRARTIARRFDEPEAIEWRYPEDLTAEVGFCGFCGTYHEEKLADPIHGVTS